MIDNVIFAQLKNNGKIHKAWFRQNTKLLKSLLHFLVIHFLFITCGLQGLITYG